MIAAVDTAVRNDSSSALELSVVSATIAVMASDFVLFRSYMFTYNTRLHLLVDEREGSCKIPILKSGHIVMTSSNGIIIRC